jgi:hypothetical protein
MAVFTVIDHEEATGDITSWCKDSIPSSYDHLLLVASTRGQKSAYFDYYKLWFNDDSIGGSNYSRTPLETKATSDIRSVRQTGQGYLAINGLVAASALADTFGTFKCWIPNYTSSYFTQVFVQWTIPNNSTSNDQWGVGAMAGLRGTTGAIDEIALGAGDGFVQYSTFTLYGITGA